VKHAPPQAAPSAEPADEFDAVSELVDEYVRPGAQASAPVVEEQAEPAPAPTPDSPDDDDDDGDDLDFDAVSGLVDEFVENGPSAAHEQPTGSEPPEVDPIVDALSHLDGDEGVEEAAKEPGDSDLDDLLGLDDSAASEAAPEPSVAADEAVPPEPRSADGTPVELDEMLQVYVDEVDALLDEMRPAVSLLASDPADADSWQIVRRCAHTVKGSAAMLGYERFRECGLNAEECADAIIDSGGATHATIGMYMAVTEWLSASLEDIRRGKDPARLPAPPLVEPPDPVPDIRPQADSESAAGVEAETKEDAPDEAMRSIFIEESTRLLEQLSQELLSLEKDPTDAETINTVLRIAHTLKGSAATLGYSRSQAVAHGMEDILQLARDGTAALDGDAADTLLAASDRLDMLTKDIYRSGVEESEADDTLASLGDAHNRMVSGEAPKPNAAPSGLGEVTGIDGGRQSEEIVALRGIFLEESRELRDALGRDLVTLERHPDDAETINNALRTAHTLKGSAAMLDFERTRSLSHAMEDSLQAARDTGAAITPETVDIMLNALDVIERIADAVERSGIESTDENVEDLVARLRGPSGEPQVTKAAAATPAKPEAPAVLVEEEPEPAPPEPAPPEQVEPSIPVPEDREEFIDLTHELQTEMARSLIALDVDASDDRARAAFSRSAEALVEGAEHFEYERIGRIAPALLAAMQAARTQGDTISKAALDALNDGVEVLAQALASVRTDGTDDAPGIEEAAAFFQEPEIVRRAGESSERAEAVPAPTPKTEAERAAEEDQRLKDERRGRSRAIEVDLDRLNRLMNLAAELVISRTRLSNELDQLGGIVSDLDTEGDTLTSIQHRLAELKTEIGDGGGNGHDAEERPAAGVLEDFSDGEFDRFTDVDVVSRDLRDSSATIAELTDEFGGMASNFDLNITRISTIAKDLHDEILRVRMVRVERAFTRLPRILRDAARAEGKQVDLTLEGAETEIDKNILEALNNPLLHLVRNTVSHGIESPEAREAAGKPAVGEVTVRARQDGNHVVLELSDDGGGIDPDAMRRTAIERLVLTPDQAGALSDSEVMELIFEPGFSTEKEVDELSGRGVGLDVVRNVTNRFNGSVSVESAIGVGTTFRITLPLTLAIGQALLVKLGGRAFALPLASVYQIEDLQPDDISYIKDRPYVYRDETPVPIVPLGVSLGVTDVAVLSEISQPVVLVREGERHVALAVDEILGREDIVIKNLGGHLRRVPGISGATILGDGSVVMILNVPYFLSPVATQKRERIAVEPPARSDRKRSRRKSAKTKPKESAPVAPEPQPAAVRRSILVVDDSVSIRKYVSGVLERSGHNVTTANDGLDAWQKVQEGAFDLVISDLEMPRMHGYELIAEIKKLERTRNIPVVFLTARAGEKHRRMGVELGAAAFLNKPFGEPELAKIAEELLTP